MKFLDVAIEESWNETMEAKQLELRRAIEQLDQKIARKLIVDEKVPPVNIDIAQMLHFLEVAVKSRDLKLVRELLKLEPDLDNAEGAFMLWLLADDADTEIATMLVRAGADLNRQNPFDQSGRSLLHILIASNSPEKHRLAVLMMAHGARVNARDSEGGTVLEYAIRKDSFEMVDQLIKVGHAHVDELVVREAATKPRALELMEILVYGEFTEAETTMEQKVTKMIDYICCLELDEDRIFPMVVALSNIEFPDGEAALVSAVMYARSMVAELFLRLGFGLDRVSDLLHLATCLEQSSVAELLIKRGADINYRITSEGLGCSGQYPIHSACQYSSHSNLKLLLRLGVDINMTDSIGNTPFSLIEDLALNDASREVIKHFAILISKGQNVNKGDLELVQSKPDLLTFYEQCLNELENMQKLKIFNHISFYTLLIEDVKQLSWLSRNCSLVEIYKNTQAKALFPLYYADVAWKFINSEKRKEFLLPEDNAACEVLSEILPELVVSKIIFFLYMGNVKEFEFEMNISLY